MSSFDVFLLAFYSRRNIIVEPAPEDSTEMDTFENNDPPNTESESESETGGEMESVIDQEEPELKPQPVPGKGQSVVSVKSLKAPLFN